MRPRREVIYAKNLKQQIFISAYSMSDTIRNLRQKSIREMGRTRSTWDNKCLKCLKT
jgi:hypothetical protein